jgi:hypothetical protein
LLVALACTAVLPACGGDDTKVTTEPTATSASTSTSTSGPCVVSGASTEAKTGASAGASSPVALLTDVRTGRQRCADRIVFDFRAGVRPEYTVEYRSGPDFALGQSDQTTTVEGSAFLVVRFTPAAGVDLSGSEVVTTYDGPDSIHPSGLTSVREIKRTEDFEAVLIWVIGLDATRPFSVGVLDGPPRVYVDIDTT